MFTQLWPWALHTAEQLACRLPPGADRDALRGEVLLEVFQATRRVDWDRYRSWPAYLQSRLHNAWSSAARAEDPLSRGQRVARRALLAAEEDLCHRLGRTPTPGERRGLADALSPHGPTPAVLFGMVVAPTAPDALPETATPADDDPAVVFQRLAARRAVHDWLDRDLPPRLATEIRTLIDDDSGDHLSRDLMRRLKPHLGSLRRRLGHDDPRQEPP
ncbi:hypothetical protein ACFQ9X_54800 [Catenulispora yoronensis]